VKVFLDSNIILYAFSDDIRQPVAVAVMGKGFEASVQVLNEIANVSRRKYRKDWDAVERALELVKLSADVIHPITIDAHLLGIKFAKRYGYSVYDSILLATAYQFDCDTLFSEDMQDGMVIENRLTIRNPFA
jgi:predicted nucleic acid-binding protein